MNYLRGIDVSRHQGSIDWPRLAPHIDEALIRCTMGESGIDDRYAANWRASGWAGIGRRGAYHYFTTANSAAGQFANILRVTGGDFGNVPFVVDCERTTGEREAMLGGWRFPREFYTVNLRDLCQRLRAVVPAGVHIYSNRWEWQTITTQPAWAAEYGFHVAAYPFDPDSTTYKPDIPAPWSDWAAWQYSSTGRRPGIAGNVDLNRVKAAPAVDPDAPAIAALASSILGLVE